MLPFEFDAWFSVREVKALFYSRSRQNGFKTLGLCLNKGVMAHFVANSCSRSMTGDHARLFIQAVQALSNGAFNGWVITTPQVGASYTTLKKRVSG